LYIHEHTEKNIRKIISFTVASGWKNLAINLTKKVTDLYNENYKMQEKEIEVTRRRKYLPCSWISRIDTVKSVILSKAIYRCNPHQNSNDIHCRNLKKGILKLVWRYKRP
jgi:hypothetical protein